MSTDNNHEEVATRFGGMFNDFLTAAKAIEELPKLHREAQLHQAARDQALAANEQLHQTISTQEDEIAALKAKVAELEASLDSASKSGAETASKLEVILSAVKGVIGEVNAAVSLVEPPAPEPTDPKESSDAASSASTPTGAATTENVEATSGGQSDPNPTTSQPTTPIGSPTTTTSAEGPEGQGVEGFTHNTSSGGPTISAAGSKSGGEESASPVSAPSPFEARSTASLTADQSQTASSPMPATATTSTDHPADQPDSASRREVPDTHIPF